MAASSQTVEQELTRLLAEVLFLEPDAIDAEATFLDLGLDSILAVEYMVAIKRDLALTLTVGTLYEHETSLKFAEFVAALSVDAVPAGPGGHDADERDASRAALRVAERWTREQVFDVVRRHVLDVMPDLGPGQVAIEGRMADLGANSIDRLDVVAGAMAELGLDLPPSRLVGVGDLRGLVDNLYEALP